MRLWILVPIAILVLVLADLSSPRFDPVFESIPASVSTSLLVMAVLTVVIGVFFATYSMPAEIESKVAFSVVTKPVSRAEIVAGKVAGLSLLVLAMLVLVGAGAYVYVVARAGGIRSLAAERLAEARPRATHPADLNALDAAARDGPLVTYAYRSADAGPDVRVHFGPDKPEPADAVWVLGDSGMRLRWNLSETPLREWVASGPGRLRLSLVSSPTPGEAAEAVKVLVGVVAPDAKPKRDRPKDAPEPQYRTQVKLAPSGEFEIAVLGPDAPATENTVNLPPGDGAYFLEVMLMQGAVMLGAKADALHILGPGGQELRPPGLPDMRMAYQGERLMIAGRADLPRQVAVFRFENVPAGALTPGRAPFEFAFSLDAWSPATVQPAAQATFINPTTGQEKAFLFTPEGNHPTVLYLEEAFWHGGPLEVRLESLTKDDFIGLLPSSLRLRSGGGPFVLHLAKAVLRVWLFGTVLAAAGVFFSVRLSWFVGILASIAFAIISIGHSAILENQLLRYLQWHIVAKLELLSSWPGWNDVAAYIVLPLPDLAALLPPGSISMGQVMSTAELAASFGWAAISTVVLTVLAALLFNGREVAA